MIRRLIILLLIVGCGTEPPSIESLLHNHLNIDIPDKYEIIKDFESDNIDAQSQRTITLKFNKEELHKVSNSIDKLISTGHYNEQGGRWTKHDNSYIFGGGALTITDWDAHVESNINLNDQTLNYILTYQK